MKVSASIEIVWQLAGQETLAAEFKEIQPEHFLAGLLKLSELPVEEVDKIVPSAEAAKELAFEVNTIRTEFSNRSIDTTRTRRKIRSILGKGSSPNFRGTLHRSRGSRDTFDAAAMLADNDGSEALTANHLLLALLDSPTPALVKIFGDALEKHDGKSTKTPLLDEYGKALVQMAADDNLNIDGKQRVERKAIIFALAQRKRNSVLLITDDDHVAEAAIIQSAHAMAKNDCPANLKNKQIIDISSFDLIGEKRDEALSKMARMLSEASTTKEIILYVPPLLDPKKQNKNVGWCETLKNTLEGETAQCICRVPSSLYNKLIKQDRSWRKLAQVIWTHDKNENRVPDEL